MKYVFKPYPFLKSINSAIFYLLRGVYLFSTKRSGRFLCFENISILFAWIQGHLDLLKATSKSLSCSCIKKVVIEMHLQKQSLWLHFCLYIWMGLSKGGKTISKAIFHKRKLLVFKIVFSIQLKIKYIYLKYRIPIKNKKIHSAFHY